VFGAELGLPQGQRLLVEVEGVGVLAQGIVAKLYMLRSVSGCSGPSLAFFSATVCLKSLRASA